MGGKRRFVTRRTDFALISRVFIRWSCNFTWMSTMHITISLCYWPISENASKWLKNNLNKKWSFTSMCKKYFLKHFLRSVNNIQMDKLMGLHLYKTYGNKFNLFITLLQLSNLPKYQGYSGTYFLATLKKIGGQVQH